MLAFQRPQTSSVGHFHAAVLGPPLVERRVADPLLTAQFLRAKPGLMLFQDANNLFFNETASLLRLSPLLENRLIKIRGLFRRAGQD